METARKKEEVFRTKPIVRTVSVRIRRADPDRAWVGWGGRDDNYYQCSRCAKRIRKGDRYGDAATGGERFCLSCVEGVSP